MVGVCRDNVEITVTRTLLFVRRDCNINHQDKISLEIFFQSSATCDITDNYLVMNYWYNSS